MTRTVLRTTIRKKLGEATAVFWADSDLNQWIEDAQLDIAWKVRCKRQRSLVTPVVSTVRYTMSSLVTNLLRIISVRIYDSNLTKWLPLKFITQDRLDVEYPQWESQDAAQPQHYCYDTELDEFILFPKADTAQIGTNYLEIYNCPKPSTISVDTASPDLPATLHPAVIDYAVATGLETRGYQDIADNHWTKYTQKLGSYMAQRDIEEDEEIVMRPE